MKFIKTKTGVFYSIIFLLSFVLLLSYASFKIKTEDYKASELLISNLMYGIEINSLGGEETINGNVVTLPAGKITAVVVKINSLNSINSNYGVDYKITSGEGKVYYGSTTIDKVSDSIENYNSTNIKEVKVFIEATKDITVEFGISGGYSFNTNVDERKGYTRIEDMYTDSFKVTLDVQNGTSDVTEKTTTFNGSLSFTVTPNDNYQLSGSSITCDSGVGTIADNGVEIKNVRANQTCIVKLKSTYPTLAEAILRDNPTISERTSFSSTNVANTTGTIYKTNKTEDGSDVYYYSGNTTNNWVKFGKYESDFITYNYGSNDEYKTLSECQEVASNAPLSVTCTEHKYASAGDDMYWRIVRTNEDGSVKLLYSGITPSTTEGYMAKSYYNSTWISPLYAGYMYGTSGSLDNNRSNTNDSLIKSLIDTWYKNNLLTNYDKYISKSAIYCNDRSVGEGTYNTGNSSFYFGAYTRLMTNKNPSYKCGANASNGLFENIQANADKFSVSTSNGGNGQLTYPIALMTADEVSFAGGVYGTNLSSPYAWYYTNSTGSSITETNYWWTMSPSNATQSPLEYAVGISAWRISGYDTMGYGGGKLDYSNVNNALAVRPTISLDSCVGIKSGNGTSGSPYEIDENSCS